MSIEKAIEAIKRFQGDSLTKSLASIENEIVGANSSDSLRLCEKKKNRVRSFIVHESRL